MLADKSRLVSYIDSINEEEEEGLHIDIGFDEPIELFINQVSVFKREFQRNK